MDVHTHSTARRRYAQLRRALRETVHVLHDQGKIPDPVADIALRVREYVAAETCAMAWTCARWGELPSIDWARAKEMRPPMVTMTKVRDTRYAPAPPTETRDQWRRVALPVALPHRSRRTVAQAILTRMEDIGLWPPRRTKRGTHSLRHLTASAMEWRGDDRDAIMRRLGHAEASTTAAYIHRKEEWRPPSQPSR